MHSFSDTIKTYGTSEICHTISCKINLIISVFNLFAFMLHRYIFIQIVPFIFKCLLSKSKFENKHIAI